MRKDKQTKNKHKDLNHKGSGVHAWQIDFLLLVKIIPAKARSPEASSEKQSTPPKRDGLAVVHVGRVGVPLLHLLEQLHLREAQEVGRRSRGGGRQGEGATSLSHPGWLRSLKLIILCKRTQHCDNYGIYTKYYSIMTAWVIRSWKI